MNPFIPDHAKIVKAIRALMAEHPRDWWTTVGVVRILRECPELVHIEINIGDVRLTLLELRAVGHLDMGIGTNDVILWRVTEDSLNGRIPAVMV